MSNTTTVQALYDYLDTCPLLTGKAFHIGGTTDSDTQIEVPYGISDDQSIEQIAVYQNGTALNSMVFSLSSTGTCTPDLAQQLTDAGLFDRLDNWLNQENAKRCWPALPEGLTPRNIRAISAGYYYQPDNDSGNYQIQLELEYYRKVVD